MSMKKLAFSWFTALAVVLTCLYLVEGPMKHWVDSQRIDKNRAVLAQCNEPGACFGGYIVLNDDRVFRIAHVKSGCDGDQIITLDEIDRLKHYDEFLSNIQTIVLQAEPQWEWYAKTHHTQTHEGELTLMKFRLMTVRN